MSEKKLHLFQIMKKDANKKSSVFFKKTQKQGGKMDFPPTGQNLEVGICDADLTVQKVYFQKRPRQYSLRKNLTTRKSKREVSKMIVYDSTKTVNVE